MRGKLIKKMIISSLAFSFTFLIGMQLTQQKNVANAHDWDGYYDQYDDVEIFKGNISIAEVTNYFGSPAVTFNIPNGMRIKDVDIDNEPHDHIEEAIMGNKAVIYGLRNGITYQNLILTLEDITGIEYKYMVNPFTINGNAGGFPNNQIPNIPNNQTPNFPNNQIPNIPQGNNGNGFIGHDMEVYKGNIPVAGITTYFGRPAIKINIPNGMRIKDVDVENEPHDHIDEVFIGGQIIIHGLRNGMTYQNLILKIEDFSGIDYLYTIDPFTIGGNAGVLPNVPNNQIPNEPQFPLPTQNTNKELPMYIKNIYQNVFNREVDKGGLDYWNAKLATKQVELEDFFKNLLSEKEFAEVAPRVEDKIHKLYTGIFQREPDEGGFRFWVEKFKQELREEGNEREALRDVIDKMTDGQEFKELLMKLGLYY